MNFLLITTCSSIGMAAYYPTDPEFNNYELCPVCYGWGKIETKAKRCFACRGEGQMTRDAFKKMRGVIKMIRIGEQAKLGDNQWPRGQALTIARPWLGPPEMVKRAVHTERLYELDCIIRGGESRRGWIRDWTTSWDGTPERDNSIIGQVFENNKDVLPLLNPKEMERFRITQREDQLKAEAKRAQAAHDQAEKELRRCREASEAQRKDAEARVKAAKVTRVAGRGRGVPPPVTKSTVVTPTIQEEPRSGGMPAFYYPPPYMSSYARGKPREAPTIGPMPLPRPKETPKEVFVTVTKTDETVKPEESKFIFLPTPKPATAECAAQTEAEGVEEVPRVEGTTQVINIHVERLVLGAEGQPEESREGTETEQPEHRGRPDNIMAMLRRRGFIQGTVNAPPPQEPEPVVPSPRRRLLPRFDFEDSE